MKRTPYKPGDVVPHPERTAVCDVGQWDMMAQVWTSRAAMARTIRMQQQREHKPGDWRALVRLTDGEGY